MNRTLIMDSGAFSAWNKGTNVDLNKYIAYLLKYQHEIDHIVGLDVIPSTPGKKKTTKEEIERSARLGFRNYNRMISKGVDKSKLMHVFHQNEDFSWLQKMIDEEIAYIGISPANDRTTQEKIMWLDEVMPYVTDKDGYPIVKFHGFGVTSFTIMTRYPWYSVDSTSWVMNGALGKILMPPFVRGAFDFTKQPMDVLFSHVSSADRDCVHNMPPLKVQVIRDYLDLIDVPFGESSFKKVDPKVYELQEGERWTKKPEYNVERVLEIGVSNCHVCRFIANAEYYTRLERALHHAGMCKRWAGAQMKSVFV